VVASVEALPSELIGVADQLTVVLPWGPLLRAFALPDQELLETVASLCRRSSSVEVTLSYEDADNTGLPALAKEHVQHLIDVYADAGIAVNSVRELGAAEARSIPSKWARKLSFGRPRSFWRIEAIRLG